MHNETKELIVANMLVILGVFALAFAANTGSIVIGVFVGLPALVEGLMLLTLAFMEYQLPTLRLLYDEHKAGLGWS